MKCKNCGTDNAQGEQFCAGCGNPLDNANADLATTPVAGAIDASVLPVEPPPQHQGPVITTLMYGDQGFPLFEGSVFNIARKGTDKCQPNLAIDHDGVSNAAIEVSVTNGTIKVRDTGTSKGTHIVKHLDPGTDMDVKPGEMIMVGPAFITIG